ncbi:AAA family ATPase [Amycolatopsis rhabdoformis]|uniref:AAA family ATPase n=1 Tax=Amycolatopsis rhabdoformis TaxID=1448059 RepID=A0ABZ1IEQ7_9PSEU|nr:AAA family ATPase [Amycolatopsis rhabdoformis]WSE32954.1 AAA family ATPase [Amycolatopsis rhabdoformis]
MSTGSPEGRSGSVRGGPRLIHLNGPSGIGKSTVARLYADRHPGVLDLDTDRIVSLIGGWRADFFGTLPMARRLAVTMTETHLRSGFSVVMPQLATHLNEVSGFEEAARAAGVPYVEIALTAAKPHAFDRYSSRSSDGPARDIDEIIGRAGGLELIDRVHDHLAAYLRQRPKCTVVDTETLDVEQTYAAVLEILGVP